MSCRKISLIAASLLIIAAGAAVFITHHDALSKSTQGLKKIDVPAFPGSQAFSWSFPLPAGLDQQHGLSLQFRRKDLPPPMPNQGVVITSQDVAISSADAQEKFGDGIILFTNSDSGPDTTGTVTVQLMDLTQLGVASMRPGQPLRVFAKLQVGVAEIPLSNNSIFLPAGSFAGSISRNDGNWVGNELFLMSFYVNGEKATYKYDVLIEKSEVPVRR